jgi:hypothetical protein
MKINNYKGGKNCAIIITNANLLLLQILAIINLIKINEKAGSLTTWMSKPYNFGDSVFDWIFYLQQSNISSESKWKKTLIV